MNAQGDGGSRKAPYTSMRSLREFLEHMRGISVPARVDRKFLQRLGVARNNEWALLSALKFLGIVDDHGLPTPVYRRLQTSGWHEVLREQVIAAYRPLLELGGETMSADELRNYFRVEYSPSQADNAARFFREIARLSDLTGRAGSENRPESVPAGSESGGQSRQTIIGAGPTIEERILALKERVLSTLPSPQPQWTADEYRDLYEHVLALLRNIDGTD
ncbi:MAG: hypothetical protein PVSMB7_25150 [Chloroflexota bacterium]